MHLFPIQYDEPIFRPPSEAYSFIIQVTLGCSWNKCAFCEMYTTKKFRVRNEEEVFSEIENVAKYSADIRKVFLADGNAMVLSTGKLLRILNKLKDTFPKLNRVSAYAIAKDLENKTVGELKELYDAGLKLFYVGIESGDDELLELINKGETFDSTVQHLSKAKEARIKSSVMIINGLGGKKYSKQHAINSARVVNALQPEYLSTLVLSFPFGVIQYEERFQGVFEEMNTTELLEEQRLFISETKLENVIFRSDHASNYLSLKGILSRDKEKMLKQLDDAINNPQGARLREEWERGL
ncbi:MAG: B12-binding domain-containing radical SAM protein [Bacteroidales bacterium]|nr:B12-binding domain-containing radical SAM protein [Bacteroidales bacterium]